MKQAAILTLSLLLLLPGTATLLAAADVEGKTNYSRNYYPSGEEKYVFRYVNGKREGATKEYFKSGKLKSYYKYKSNVIVNAAEFYETGELKYKFTYKNGERNGYTYEFDKNKKIIDKWPYKNNVLQQAKIQGLLCLSIRH